MSELPDFENLLRLREQEDETRRQAALRQTSEERRLQAAAAAIEARKAAAQQVIAQRAQAKEDHIKQLHAAKQSRDQQHQGTPPEAVWDDEMGRLCGQFLDYMSQRAFMGAVALRHQEPEDPWSIKGYGVGCIALGTKQGFVGLSVQRLAYAFRPSFERESLLKGTNQPHNVYLCEDGQLRFYSNQAVTPDNIPRRNSAPSHIAGLPLDAEGNTMNPLPGHFAQGEMHSKREVSRRRGGFGTMNNPNPVRWETVEENFVILRDRIVPQPLPHILVNYVPPLETQPA